MSEDFDSSAKLTDRESNNNEEPVQENVSEEKNPPKDVESKTGQTESATSNLDKPEEPKPKKVSIEEAKESETSVQTNGRKESKGSPSPSSSQRRVRMSLDDQIITAEETSGPRQSVSLTSMLQFLKTEEQNGYIDEDILKGSEGKSTVENVSVTLSKDFAMAERRGSDDKWTEISLSSKRPSLDMQSNYLEMDEEDINSEIHQDKKSSEDIQIDRKMYYEMYSMFLQQNNIEKRKNNYLQSRLAAYYMKRKMFYILKETAPLEETMGKYEKDLDALDHLCESSEREKVMHSEELAILKNKHQTKTSELQVLFDQLQQAELEYGKGLTFEKTGRMNMDKLVERFVRRQKNQMNLLIKLRMTYIRLRNKFAEKTTALDELDHLGPGYRIMDYVQLKMDNRNLHDKLEEKETELTKLRANCQNVMQILAHNREKIAVLNLDMDKMREDLDQAETEFLDAREQVSYLKRERDIVRKQIKDLKLQYGLLTNMKMLRDMESSLKEVDALKKEIEKVKVDHFEKSKQLEAVRKNMEYFMMKKKREKEKEDKQKLKLNLSDSLSSTSLDKRLDEIVQSRNKERSNIFKKHVFVSRLHL